MVVAVVGAGGPTGAECVKRLLADGQAVRAVVRDPAKYAGQASLWGPSETLQVVAGDVTRPDTLKTALEGVKNVIITSSGKAYLSAHAVDNQGVGNVAAAAKETGVEHVVLVSSMLVSPHNRWHPVRIMLNNFRWSLMDHKYAGEGVLRASGVPYTVVRPGGLNSSPAGQNQLLAGQGDTLRAGTISRADVAAVCVAALNNPAARNVTFELGTVRGAAPVGVSLTEQIHKLWQGLKPDGAPAE